MKRILLCLAGILIVSGGCDSTIPDRGGTLVGTLQDETWRGTARADFAPDTFVIWSTRRVDAGIAQHLTIRVVETAPGSFAVVTQAMSADAGGFLEVLGGDGTVYSAAVTDGTIRFTELDRRAGRASGTVSLTLTGTRGTWRFEAGEFQAYNWRSPTER